MEPIAVANANLAFDILEHGLGSYFSSAERDAATN